MTVKERSDEFLQPIEKGMRYRQASGFLFSACVVAALLAATDRLLTIEGRVLAGVIGMFLFEASLMSWAAAKMEFREFFQKFEG